MKQKTKNDSTYIVEKYEDESIVKFSKNMQQNAKKMSGYIVENEKFVKIF